MSKLPYNTAKDFAPVATLATAGMLMSVKPSLAATDIKSFIALAKAKPGALNYGMVGNAGIGRIAGELLASSAGIEFAKIPFRGRRRWLTS